MKFLHFLEQQFINAAVFLITAYQQTFSPDHGPKQNPTCRFTPTCSDYTKNAIICYGVWGMFLGFWRIIRCNPLMTKAGTHEEIPEILQLGKFILRRKIRGGSADITSS